MSCVAKGDELFRFLVVLPHGMAGPAVGQEHAAQVRVAFEADAVHVEHLALVPVGGGKQVLQAGAGGLHRLAVDLLRHDDAQAQFSELGGRGGRLDEAVEDAEVVAAVVAAEVGEDAVAERLGLGGDGEEAVRAAHQDALAVLEDFVAQDVAGVRVAHHGVVARGFRRRGRGGGCGLRGRRSGSVGLLGGVRVSHQKPNSSVLFWSRIFCCSFCRPSSRASGRGGQPGMYTSTGMILSTPLTTK
jgi:hypothetical protein